MNELDKIQEAKYFFSQMIKEKENRENFKFNLSAFLSSSRSVLQYALKEAKTKKCGQKWYSDQVSRNRVVGFLKDKRDINIHTKPPLLKRDIELKMSETIHISEFVTMTIKDNGKGFELPERVGDLAKSGKLGLAGMQERIQLIGGKLTLHSSPGEGTAVTVEVPI